MKKKKLFLLLCILGLAIGGCESVGQIRAASISEVTAAGSNDYAVRFVFNDDKRIEEKYYDIQLMSNTDNLSIIFHREGEDKISVDIKESNRWLSMTTLKLSSASMTGSEKFNQLKNAVDETYIFNFNKPCKITFRVVAGDAVDASSGSGQILANSEPISKDFILKANEV